MASVIRVLCVIDHFGSGGAQRQMVQLARVLKQREHAVEMFIYYQEFDFFRSRVHSVGIPVHESQKKSRWSWRVLVDLASLLSTKRFDIVLSFLDTPNVYTELSTIADRSARIVVSERRSHYEEGPPLVARAKRELHRLADHVVVNSHSHKQWLVRKYPWLEGKVSTIYNGVDLELFGAEPGVPKSPEDLRLLAIGQINHCKNPLTLVEASKRFFETHGWCPVISWVGRCDPKEGKYYQGVLKSLHESPEVAKRWRWLGEREDIRELLSSHHALVHPSLYEGLPNVVCEALASGRPVLVSDVCDHGELVTDGERGFLFDPHSAASISEAIENLAMLRKADWVRLSNNASRYARASLTIDGMASEYEALFRMLLSGAS